MRANYDGLPKPRGAPAEHRIDTPQEVDSGIVRRRLFDILRLLHPFVAIPCLALLAVCIILLLFSFTFPKGTHFPSALITGMALSCGVANYAYGRLMNLVEPPI